MELGLIYARSRNGVIGKDNALPWRLPEDLAHFKAVTLGCPVIMGRRTWDSLPPKFRPLPGRRNIVVTHDDAWRADGVDRAASLDQALALCGDAPRVWVIGGAQIYRLAAPRAHVAQVTVIDADYDGDAFAPELPAHWRETARENHVSDNGLPFSFVTYRNTQQPEG